MRMAAAAAIRLQDQVSDVLYQICGAVDLAVDSMLDMQDAMDAGLGMASFAEAREDLEAINSSYMQLSGTVNRMEGPMQSNADKQARFNRQLLAGVSGAEQLLNAIQSIGSAYVSIQGNGEMAVSYASEGAMMAGVSGSPLDGVNADEDAAVGLESLNAKISQIWTKIQEDAAVVFEPFLQSLDRIANSQGFNNLVNTAIQAFSRIANSDIFYNFVNEIEKTLNILNNSGIVQGVINGVVLAFGLLINIATFALNLIGSVAGFVADNWSMISPIIYGVVAALIAYALVAAYVAVVNSISALSQTVDAAARTFATGATLAYTVAQHGLNAALLACPITWIVLGFIALIVVIYAVCAAIAEMTGAAGSGLGIILGCVYVINTAFENLLLLGKNFVYGMDKALYALSVNLEIAFHNSIEFIKLSFYDLLSTVLSIVAEICKVLDGLPFISFDYSGILEMARDFEVKAAAQNGIREYVSIIDAFINGWNTYEAFPDGWVSDAFKEGAAKGDEILNNLFKPFSDIVGNKEGAKASYIYPEQEGNPGGMGSDIGNNINQVVANTGQTAENTATMADALDISNEQLKYLRDIAERETVNRFTTASIKVEMTNNNQIHSDMDLDGIVNGLAVAVGDAMFQTAEGVHI